MRLIGFNYTSQSETVISTSSENVNFPVSNLKHDFRTKEWRSSGHFLISSSNNTLSYNAETVTIPGGSYSASELAEAIQDQMGDDFSVSYAEATGRWTISSDASFSLDIGTNSILPTIGFSSNLGDQLSYTSPTAAIHTSEFITLDLKTTEEINSIALLWGKGEYKLTSEAVIRVQANATNEWSAPAVNQILAFDDTYEIASHYFTESQSYRYWRVSIVDPANVNGYVHVGVIVLGQSEELDNPDNGFQYSQSDNSVTTSTPFGVEYTDEYPVIDTLSLNFNLMEYDAASALINLYRAVGNKRPVFIALSDSEGPFAKDCFSIYGKFSGSQGYTHITYNLFQSTLTVREIN